MKLLTLVPALLLSACVATPVARHFPEAPAEITAACPDLNKLEQGTTKMSEVVTVVSKNYGQYQECQIKVDAWIEWHKSQKAIFDSVK